MGTMKDYTKSAVQRHSGYGNSLHMRHLAPFSGLVWKMAMNDNAPIPKRKNRPAGSNDGAMLLVAMELHRRGERWVTVHQLSTLLGIDSILVSRILVEAASRGEISCCQGDRKVRAHHNRYSLHGKVATYESPFDVCKRKEIEHV